jgi:hypothetical protein
MHRTFIPSSAAALLTSLSSHTREPEPKVPLGLQKDLEEAYWRLSSRAELVSFLTSPYHEPQVDLHTDTFSSSDGSHRLSCPRHLQESIYSHARQNEKGDPQR